MPFLARRVKGVLWANASDPERWVGSEFPFELLTDLLDKGGVGISVWEVKSKVDPTLKRVAAALMMGSKTNPGREVQSIEFRLADKARVEALGIKITSSLGDTRDNEINGLHRDLSDLNAKRAVALLRLMKTRACVFSAKEVARFVATGLVRQHLPMDALTKELLWNLHQRKPLKITIS
jgi:hypothetical protein